MEWKGDTETALAVISRGWHNEAERVVMRAAQDFISNIAREVHLEARKNATCRTCGHNPLDGDKQQ